MDSRGKKTAISMLHDLLCFVHKKKNTASLQNEYQPTAILKIPSRQNHSHALIFLNDAGHCCGLLNNSIPELHVYGLLCVDHFGPWRNHRQSQNHNFIFASVYAQHPIYTLLCQMFCSKSGHNGTFITRL